MPFKNPIGFFILTTGIFLSVYLEAGELTRFEIKDLTQRNMFGVILEAPLEKVLAQCQLFHGAVELNPQQLEKGIQGELEIDLRSFHSGSGVRDSIFFEKVLDNRQYPLATLKLKKWAQEVKGSLTESPSSPYRVEGTLNYRDQTLPVILPLQMSYFVEGEKTKARLPGNLLHISSRGHWDFKAVGISVPSELKFVVGTQAEILFDAVGSDKVPNDKILLPEGPKPKERS